MQVIFMDYSKKILIIRANLGLTQEELPNKLNVAFSTINRWENKKTMPNKRYRYLLDSMFEECTKEVNK